MKNEKKPGNTFVRVLKAYLFGIMSGILLIEYLQNRKRPYLPYSPEAEGEKQENLENKEKENVQ